MTLPADTHVHSEFSWDTGGPTSPAAGTMRATCARAVEMGLRVVIFTEHLDLDGWQTGAEDWGDAAAPLIDHSGWLQPPPFAYDQYFASVEACRAEFPDVRILTGVELGQPHLDAHARFDRAGFDRVNGSLHTLPFRGSRYEPVTLFRELTPAEVIRAYLAEVPAMVEGAFDVYTHIDYAVRYWPTEQHGPFDPAAFEDGFRQALRTIAGSGRALEMNTGHGGLRPWIPQWWAEEGGRAVSFGSDDHRTSGLAAHFDDATALLGALGFRPGRRPEDFWTR